VATKQIAAAPDRNRLVTEKVCTIIPLERPHYEEALKFTASEFCAGSTLHRALGIHSCDYIKYLRQPFLSLAAENLSFIALDSATNSIVGCILSGDYSCSSAADNVTPDQLKPIAALIRELEEKYKSHRVVNPGSILLVDIAVVAHTVRGQGIYRQLRNTVHDAGTSRGFKYVIGELSSLATQQLCVKKLGHKVVCEIQYDRFEYQGDYPFVSIKEPACIQLVEGVLG